MKSKSNDPQFSIYLSNDEQSPGFMSFGGYDLKYAKEGSKDSDVNWVGTAANEAYWTMNSASVGLGDDKFVNDNQFVILDNGMSLAMAPMKVFGNFLKSLYQKHKVACLPVEGLPMIPCKATKEQYKTLPDLEFTIVAGPDGKKVPIKMPKEAYMKFTQENETGFTSMLLINPWEFQGLGGKEGEEYWVLGAQFLQNYLTIYDFAEKKIGLIESKTSVIGNPPEVKVEENPFKKVSGDADPEKQI